MNTLISILFATAHIVASAVGYHPQPVVQPAPQQINLGAAPSPIAGSVYTLAGGGVSPSATSIILSSLTIKQSGQPILTGDLRQGASDKFYVTLEPGSNSRQEIVGCTGVTQNSGGTATLTTCSRGLSPVYPYAASTTLAFTHGGGTQAVFGDAPQLFNDFKAYVDSAVVSGAVDASLSAKGILEKASGNEAASHAAVGSGNTTAPLALDTSIASSTRTANTAQVVVASSTDGYIDYSFLNLTRSIPGFSATVATSTFATTSTNIGAFPAHQIGMNRTVITAFGTSTFAIPNGITKIHVQAVGGGGGGGGSNSASVSAGGGGAAAYMDAFVDVTGTSSVIVFVGTGGAGGASTNTGSSGLWSTFGANGFYMTALPGVGGTGSGTKTGGAGGATTTPASTVSGLLAVPGGSGQDGITATALAEPGGIGALGGSSFFGNQGSSQVGTLTPFGSGGPGGENQSGNPGAPGAIIITW